MKVARAETIPRDMIRAADANGFMRCKNSDSHYGAEMERVCDTIGTTLVGDLGVRSHRQVLAGVNSTRHVEVENISVVRLIRLVIE